MSEPFVTLLEADTFHTADIPEHEGYWRMLGKAPRDVQEIDFDRQRENAIWIARTSGIARRYLEIITDFTAGEEPRPQAEDETLQEVLDGFWFDPVNQMTTFSRDLASQLRLMGEQFLTAHIRETDGRLRLGYLDPKLVGEVAAMPSNPRDLREVRLKAAPGEITRCYRIIRPHEELSEIYGGVSEEGKRGGGRFALLPRDSELRPKRDALGRFVSGAYDGAIFAFQVNRLTNMTRGLSDLFSDIDFLEKLDAAVFDTAERARLLRMLALDVMVAGCSDEKKIRAIQKTVEASFAKSGSSFGHNETVTVTPHVPDLKSADMRELVKLVLLHLLGSWGFPLHWFGDGGEANLATAGEMGGPTIRKLQSAQALLRGYLRHICDFQIALKLALAPEELSGVEDPYAYEIVLPEIVGKDTAREAQALAGVLASVQQAAADNLITTYDAALITQSYIAAMADHEFSDLNTKLLDKLRELSEQEIEEMGAEPEIDPMADQRPFDDGQEPEDEDEAAFADQQDKPLPPEMKAKADAMKRAAS